MRYLVSFVFLLTFSNLNFSQAVTLDLNCQSLLKVPHFRQYTFPTDHDEMWKLVEDTYDILGSPEIPLHGLEYVPEGEKEAVMDTVRIFHEFYKIRYANTQSKRGVHPKAHGGLKGRMIVNKNLADYDIVGIFQPGAEYNVDIRFSNADPFASPNDEKGDSRGFGMKVHGVKGDKLFKNHPHLQDEPETQGFTLNTVPTFFSDNAITYRDFMQMALLESDGDTARAVRRFLPRMLIRQPLLAARIFNTFFQITRSSPKNLFDAEYFSITPFQHGQGTSAPVVKYKVESCSQIDHNNITEGPDFLSQNLKDYMANNDACLKFMVQDYQGGLYVEDPTREWQESVSPFRELARIYIPKQDLLDPATVRGWIINPWNTLPEHKPLGGINRTRLTSYLFSIMARFRMQNESK